MKLSVWHTSKFSTRPKQEIAEQQGAALMERVRTPQALLIGILFICCAEIGAQAQTAETEKPAFRIQGIGPPEPPFRVNRIGTPESATPHAVNCPAMESELVAAATAFNAICEGHTYKQHLQQCSSLSNRLLISARRLHANSGVCKTWSAADLQNNIEIARANLRNISIVRNSGGGGSRAANPTPAEQFGENMRRAACASRNGGYYTPGYMNCVE